MCSNNPPIAALLPAKSLLNSSMAKCYISNLIDLDDRTMNTNSDTLLIALGGNAITREFEESDITTQFANTRRSLLGVAELICRGYRVILTHGNGPQVGNYMIRVEASRNLVPPLPLGVMVADLQGGMGYMIAQTMSNYLMKRGVKRDVVTVLTQVVVDRDDPSIHNPTKFVGLTYKEEDVYSLRTERGWIMKEDVGRGFRRVVPSPIPKDVVEKDTIRRLVEQGVVVIAAGGGGIPVFYHPSGELDGVDAVIDKDLASAVLAREVGADHLYILTAVDKVQLDFKKPSARSLDTMTVAEARKYLAEGQFPPGSMGPKVRACCEFIEAGAKTAVITSVDTLLDSIEGKSGTRIVR